MFHYTKATHPNKNQSTGHNYLYNWILKHPRAVMSPIANICLKLSINGQVEPWFVPKILLQVSVIDLHNSMLITQEERVLKESRDVDNNIIISNLTLRKILPPQLNKMTS